MAVGLLIVLMYLVGEAVVGELPRAVQTFIKGGLT
jgi:hypothetical protein